jgi:hypothetical protein
VTNYDACERRLGCRLEGGAQVLVWLGGMGLLPWTPTVQRECQTAHSGWWKVCITKWRDGTCNCEPPEVAALWEPLSPVAGAKASLLAALNCLGRHFGGLGSC